MIIDTNVQPHFRSNAEIRDYLPKAHRLRAIPDVEQQWYQAPGGDYRHDLYGQHYPGSDPETVARHLFDDQRVQYAILNPLTRGNIADYLLNSRICAAVNDWLLDRWLEPDTSDRFRGTIRVNPDDIAGAVREIEKWRAHPRVVQVGVPLQSRELYGKPQFWPLWEAAADANLPVAVHIETGEGIGFPPTPSGHTLTYEQYVSFMALNYIYHLMNMIAEGVFERFSSLKFVWADGAADFLTPFIWRMDTFGRPHLEQTPWAPRIPSDYIPGHVYFVQGSLDGPGDTDFAGEWFGFTGKEDMVMFGSSYPHWQSNDIRRLPTSLSTEQRDKLCWRNAADLYGIDISVDLAAG
jgi:predicted TIM-barrel fold metal-dependent hydrolase